MRNNKKLNDGCLKIFEFLKLLYNDEAEYSKVLEIFQDEIKETTTNNIQVTLNKYINTLRVFGLKIKKENGKTFTIANVIARTNRPTLVLAHNKTLAGQLYSELKELFPENRVEYFVSYYDYYQPEAYVRSTDT